ncbi:MAG: DoxX family protein [Gammaproteobacteria bacterium]|nr:DoxX family protein [Gammaproteobacteria bacterium]NNF62113.1 DoxX family protein [Gammaproteobacteria bacterium]NNM20497.1 DoxX family protein [Gammaproteobacteria bacterium]
MEIRRWPIEALRIYTGIFFAYHGFGKLTRETGFNITGFLEAMKDKSFGFYQPLIESVFLPNAGLFSGLVAWGELLVGVALVLGVAVRYASIAGAFMLANFWFAKGQSIFDGQNHDAIWVAIFLVLALVPAGKFLGLDQKLADRFSFLR